MQEVNKTIKAEQDKFSYSLQKQLEMEVALDGYDERINQSYKLIMETSRRVKNEGSHDTNDREVLLRKIDVFEKDIMQVLSSGNKGNITLNLTSHEIKM